MSAISNVPVQATVNLTTNATADLLAAPGAGKYNYITTLTVTNGHASVGSYVKIIDETSGAILERQYAAAGGGGFSINYDEPGLKQLVANKKVQVVCETNGSDVSVTVFGYVQS